MFAISDLWKNNFESVSCYQLDGTAYQNGSVLIGNKNNKTKVYVISDKTTDIDYACYVENIDTMDKLILLCELINAT